MIPPTQTAGQSHQAYQVTHAMQSPTIIHNVSRTKEFGNFVYKVKNIYN